MLFAGSSGLYFNRFSIVSLNVAVEVFAPSLALNVNVSSFPADQVVGLFGFVFK